MQVSADVGTAAAITAFLEATVRVATPLGVAAAGAVWLGGPWAGLMAAAVAGLLVAAVFAALTVGLDCDQIVVGTAVTLGAIGLTGAGYRLLFGPEGAALSVPTLQPLAVPMLAIALRRLQLGLAIRAAGDAPRAADATGLDVRRIRAGAAVFGGLMGGLAGGALVVAQAGTFAERMTAGRGFIAIAIAVLGRWEPLGALAAALVFGAASALQYAAQALGLDVPYQLVLMVPYVLSLLALAGALGRMRAPAALRKPYLRGGGP